MEKEWRLYTKKADFSALSKELGVSAVLAKVMRNRDLTNIGDMKIYLHADLSDLYDPMLMKGMSEAVGLIGELMPTDDVPDYGATKVAVATDYDCDGIFSGYILKYGLTKLGFDVKLYTPDRTTEGYGLNRRIIDEACEDERELLITCDNGIAAVDEVDYAIEQGMTVIITDHHEPQEVLPRADVILDPKQPDETYPFSGLCGAGVAFKLICALYREYLSEADETELLEYVAIATVADVMELVDENRILVKTGIKKLQTTKNLGLKELIRLQGLMGKDLSAGHIGFIIGPCFNSAGRISSVNESFEVLEAKDSETANSAASRLKAINDERKNMTEAGVKAAVDLLCEKYPVKGDVKKVDESALPDVIVIKVDGVHESLVGIVAGRIKELYNHPVIVFCEAEPIDGETVLKGSGRSIAAYHMFNELMKCKDIMLRFGGHAMAAGLTIREDELSKLDKRLNEASTLSPEDFKAVMHIDAELPIDRLNEGLIAEIELLAPFGVGNPGPLFAQRALCVAGVRYMGEDNRHLRLSLTSPEGKKIIGVAFGEGESFRQYITKKYGKDVLSSMERHVPTDVRLTVAYVPEINEYNGSRTIQLSVKGWV